jgi:cysteine desulfurase
VGLSKTSMNGSRSSAAVAATTSLSCFVAGVVAASLWFRVLRKGEQPNSCVVVGDYDHGDKKEETPSSTSSSCIYLDYNGTTPVYPFVIDAMMPFLTTHYGNPSSSHVYGHEPRRAVDRARLQILKLIGLLGNHNKNIGDPSTTSSSIWFTSCGTESDNLAIQLALQSSRKKLLSLASAGQTRPHIVTCNVEHPAIDGCLKALQQQDEQRGGQQIDVTYVPVQSDGRVLAQDVIQAIDVQRTILVTLMLANNETGALQPVPAVAKYCREHGILFHTDAAQAAGKVSVEIRGNVNDNDRDSGCGCADMVTLVGHKIGAPKGVACLYVRPGCLEEHGRSLLDHHNHGVLLIGGGQEFGRRGGTENVPHIVAMGAAAERIANSMDLRENAARMETLRTRLLHQLRLQLGCAENEDTLVRPNGPMHPEHRLPNTLSVGIRNVHSGDLLAAVSDQVAASAGATCHSAAGVSSVLKAMNVPIEFARGTLRLSLGPTTTAAQIDRAAAILAKAAKLQLQQNES